MQVRKAVEGEKGWERESEANLCENSMRLMLLRQQVGWLMDREWRCWELVVRWLRQLLRDLENKKRAMVRWRIFDSRYSTYPVACVFDMGTVTNLVELLCWICVDLGWKEGMGLCTSKIGYME